MLQRAFTARLKRALIRVTAAWFGREGGGGLGRKKGLLEWVIGIFYRGNMVLKNI